MSGNEKNKKKGTGRARAKSDKTLDTATCTKCQTIFTDDNDQLLQCDRCDGWVCRQCLGINEKEYKFLHNRPDLHWYCLSCQEPALQAVQSEKLIEDRCKFYMEQFDKKLDNLKSIIDLKADKSDLLKKADKTDLNTKADKQELADKASKQDLEAKADKQELLRKADITDLDEKADKVDLLAKADRVELQSKADIQDLNAKADKEDVTKLYKDVMQEVEDRERRKKNMIVINMPEKENITTDECREEDKSAFLELCETYLDSKPEIAYCKRLGKKPEEKDKHRPLSVSFTNEMDRNNILAKANKLRLAEDESVKAYILIPDRTPAEREMRRQLRQELLAKREEAKKSGQNEEIWIIRNNKVIQKPQ